ncbi:MAG: BamA/TamA family outer membrane protein [Bryobacteraceae bacterium]
MSTTQIAVLVLLCPLLAYSQVDSRAAEIQAERQKKSETVKPESNPGIERTLLRINDQKIVERILGGLNGLRIKLGGLAVAQGFAVGPEYVREDLAKGQVRFRAAAIASIAEALKYDLQLTLPKLAGEHVFVDLYSAYANMPRIQYYGPGPDSKKTGRSNFRRETAEFDAVAGIKPLRHLTLAAKGGYLMVNTGPGTHDDLASIEQNFNPIATPGLDRQSDFLRGGGFIQYDYRDIPGGPKSGGNYKAEFTYHSDRTFQAYSFNMLDLEVQQYIPFFNQRRVIALRGKTVLTDAGRGQQVPFYLQPVLGGSETLRGFRPYRFYDNNLLVLNAEYRWESFSGLDMAIFVDGGKVFPRTGDLNFRNLEGSAGFGFRFNVRNSVFLRVDVGFSHEGFQVWFKFNNVF